jgi:Flp pilus assembly secretin CpaC
MRPIAAVSARHLSHIANASHISRVTLVSGAMLVMASLFVVGKAKASDLVVAYDQSQLLRLSRPVASVIIGNPSIADVAIQGGNLLVVTGKTFGVTNIISLDSERNIIQDQRVIVTLDEVRIVNLNKGALRQSYSCTPNCSPTLTIGDDKDYFELISKHAETKTKFSNGDSGENRDQ